MLTFSRDVSCTTPLACILAYFGEFVVYMSMLSFSHALEIINVIICRVFVDMVNVVSFWDFTMVVRPDGALNSDANEKMFVRFLAVNNAVKFLVSVVNDFNGRRGCQVAFENVNPVPFKIVGGVVAEDLQSGNNFGCKLHDKSLLAKLGGACYHERTRRAPRYCMSLVTDSLARGLFVCKETNMTKLERLKARLQMYYEAERKIANGAAEYQLGDRRLRRPDLSAVRAAITELEDEISLLENSGGRVRRVVFID